MSSFPLLTEPLTDGTVVLRDYAERDIPEILIAHQDDPRMHLLHAARTARRAEPSSGAPPNARPPNARSGNAPR